MADTNAVPGGKSLAPREGLGMHYPLLKAETYSLESKPREILYSVILTKGADTKLEGKIK